MGVVPRKTVNLKKWVEIKKKTTFVTKRLKMGKWWDQIFCMFKMPGFVDPV